MKQNLLKLFCDAFIYKKSEIHFNSNTYKSACCLLSKAHFTNKEFKIFINKLLYNSDLLSDFDIFQSIGVMIKSDLKKQDILIEDFYNFIIILQKRLKNDEILTDVKCTYIIEHILSRFTSLSNKNFNKLYQITNVFLQYSNIDCYNKLMLLFLKLDLSQKQIQMINNNLINDFIDIHKSNYSSTYLSKDTIININFVNFKNKLNYDFMIDTLFLYGLQMSKLNDMYKYAIWSKILENIYQDNQIIQILEEIARDDSTYSKDDCINSLQKNENIRIHHWLFFKNQLETYSPASYIHSILLKTINSYISLNEAKLLLKEFNVNS